MKVKIVGNNLRYNLPKIQEEEGIGEKKDQASCNVRKLDRKACVSVGFISSNRKLICHDVMHLLLNVGAENVLPMPGFEPTTSK